MPLPPELLSELENMPCQLEQTLSWIPSDRIRWRPESWGGCPSETFSVLEQICHLRDIERDGYHVRIRRMLEEVEPFLESLDSYKMAREQRYEATDLNAALIAFRDTRSATLQQLRSLTDVQLARTGEFAEYGRLSLRALVHYLRSHDQQHLAGILGGEDRISFVTNACSASRTRAACLRRIMRPPFGAARDPTRPRRCGRAQRSRSLRRLRSKRRTQERAAELQPLDGTLP